MVLFPIKPERVGVHASINFKSWRTDLTNDIMHQVSGFYKGYKGYNIKELRISHVPRNTYGLYSDHISKRNAQYPTGLKF